MENTPVLIAGGGPVGLSLACDLKWRGIEAILVEQNESTTTYPKMDVTNARTMEHFRRIGLAQRIRDAAVPEDHHLYCRWISDFAGIELGVKANESPVAQRAAIRAANDGTQPLEPYMRMPQYDLEPLLKEVIEEPGSGIDVRFGWQMVSFEQDEEGVSSVIRHASSGEEQTIRSAYLVGTDGGGSVVRKGLGIQSEGLPRAVEIYMIHFTTDNPEPLLKFGRAWHWHMLKTNSVLISQNDGDSFTLHQPVPPGTDEAEVDPRQIIREALGVELDCEIHLAELWHAHWLVARRYGEGRVWLAGDATHQYLPTGGYGMNTGVPDAMDVSWKIAAVLQGWGGDQLLDSITDERRAAGLHSRRGSFAQAEDRFSMLFQLDPSYLEEGEAGEGARERAAGAIDAMLADERGNLGVALGYSYADSPIVEFEGASPPGLSVWNYTPTTYPGFRAPHVFLEDGSAIFDHFGPGFTLVNFGDQDTALFEQAAANCGMPLKVINLQDANARDVYEKELLLIRPDQHVAWRGDLTPFVIEEAQRIIDKVRGHR